MRLLASLFLSLSLVLPFILPTHGHEHPARRHHLHRQGDLTRRDSGGTCTNARFTYYADGLGACGVTNQPGDFIVALNSAQFELSLCNQQITITVGGQSLTATIMDECPGCPPCGLDFSQGLFQAFAALSVGVLSGDWSYDSGGSSPSSSPPPPPPPTSSVDTPTTSWVPSPTTTSQPPPTTTSSVLPTTSSSSSKATTASSGTSGLVSTQTTSNIIAEPTGAVIGGSAESSVLVDLDLYLALFGDLLEACSG